MDLITIREKYAVKQAQVSNALNALKENAVNYSEELEAFEDKSKIDLYSLEWNNSKDKRNFEILMDTSMIIERIIETIDEISDAGEDNKKKHRSKKSLETLISLIRKIKKQSKEFIDNEQQLQDTTNEALKLLGDIKL
jgi:hypothetical protein